MNESKPFIALSQIRFIYHKFKTIFIDWTADPNTYEYTYEFHNLIQSFFLIITDF
jgi:hypothetical protein